jgi:hypothetical protein
MAYSWDDDHDFDVSVHRGYSYKAARRSYDDVAVAKNARKAHYTFREPFLETDSAFPIIIGVDTTGSMQEWPKTFFEKLPLLYKEAVKYVGDCAISFQAINDYFADGADNALQPAPFAKGAQLDEIIGQLYPVGGGGGQGTESYEMFAAYNSFVKAPKALIKPVAIILGDEAPFESLPKEVATHYELGTGGACSCKEAFKRLHEKCDVFMVHKSYFGDDKAVLEAWRTHALMADERILSIEDPRRVVDVILGVLGVITGKTELFREELEQRQEPGQVREVMQSLHRLQQSVQSPADLSQRSFSPTLHDPSTADTVMLDFDDPDS